MGTLDRAEELAAALNAQGVRATLDPSMATPPCVLITPPTLTFEVACGATAEWSLVALAPAVQTADRNSWQTLEDVALGVTRAGLDVERADPSVYVLNGKNFPAYLMTIREAIEWQ